MTQICLDLEYYFCIFISLVYLVKFKDQNMIYSIFNDLKIFAFKIILIYYLTFKS